MNKFKVDTSSKTVGYIYKFLLAVSNDLTGVNKKHRYILIDSDKCISTSQPAIYMSWQVTGLILSSSIDELLGEINGKN